MVRMPIVATLFVALLACPAGAAQCGGDFSSFVASMSREAASAGVSQNVISNAFMGVTQDQAVLAFDRRQRGTFRKTFEEYVSTRVGAGRIKRGTQLLQRHAALLARIASSRSSAFSQPWRTTAAAPSCSNANCCLP
jgi:membrane-bound lytic murein transglycosylase B